MGLIRFKVYFQNFNNERTYYKEKYLFCWNNLFYDTNFGQTSTYHQYYVKIWEVNSTISVFYYTVPKLKLRASRSRKSKFIIIITSGSRRSIIILLGTIVQKTSTRDVVARVRVSRRSLLDEHNNIIDELKSSENHSYRVEHYPHGGGGSDENGSGNLDE